MIGALCDASAALRIGDSRKCGVHTVGDHGAAMRGEDEGRFAGHAGRHGWRWPVSPSALIWRTPCSSAHTAIDAATIANRMPSDIWQFHPPGQHRSGKVAVTDEQHVTSVHVLQRVRDGAVGPVADLLRRFTARASVRPHQPVGHGLSDLPGWSGPRSRRNPIRPEGRHLVDRQSGKFGGHHRTLPGAGDHQRIVEAVAPPTRPRSASLVRDRFR